MVATTVAPTTAPPTTAAPATEPPTTAAPIVTEPPTTAASEPEPATPEAHAIVTDVVDGDTVDLASGERVRLIGIDTPERGQCGYHEATAAMSDLVQGKGVVVTPGAVDDKDRYGRILRNVDVDGTDAGLAMIRGGYAIARYDSRDGYGPHPREAVYVTADAVTPPMCANSIPPTSSASQLEPAAPSTTVSPQPRSSYANCAEARAAGVTPLYRGQPGYASKLDRDGEGVACE
jgi:endonuclease YncB( thermonuclease family)